MVSLLTILDLVTDENNFCGDDLASIPCDETLIATITVA
jgi:hypothetical protein